MVFESITAKILNKVLADYVETFDKEALKIGIWHGTLELKNLDLKISAFVHDELDLPVKIKVCRIEKITIKIPWRSICSQPVAVSVDGLYVLAEPDILPTLNPEKEEKDKKEKKQKKMHRNEKENKAIAEKEKKSWSFFETVIMWIVKSMQIRICNIHIQLEDNFSSPKHFFSIGLSLAELSLEKTKETKVQGEENKQEFLINKLVKMHSLAVYWDIDSRQYTYRPLKRLLEDLKTEFVPESAALPHQWLIRPFSSDGYIGLDINPKMNKFKFPKILLENGLDTIDMEISKLQYDSMMEMVMAFEKKYQTRENMKHQKEDPSKHAENSQAKVRVVNQTPIKSMAGTTDRFERQVKSSKEKKRLLKEMIEKRTEGELGPFNRFLFDQDDFYSIPFEDGRSMERSTDRLGRQIKSSYGIEMDIEEKTFKERIEEVLNEKEKTELFATIGYKENEVDDAFPEDFVAVKVLFRMKKINLTLTDESKTAQVLKLKLNDVYACVEKKPAKNVIQVKGQVNHLTMEGPQQDGIAPIVIESKNIDGDDTYPFLDVFLERNPTDMLCDTRVIVKVRPLQIVFKDIFIKNTIAFLKPPEEAASIKRLLKAATVWLKGTKDSKVEGAMKQSKRKDVSVELMPWCITFPFGEENQTYDAIEVPFDLGNQEMHSMEEKQVFRFDMLGNEKEILFKKLLCYAQHIIMCYNCEDVPAVFCWHLCKNCRSEHETKKNNVDLPKCLDHKAKTLEWFCNRCVKPACTECIKSSHNGHSVDRISTNFREITNMLKGEKKKIEKALLPEYELAIERENAKQIAISKRADEIERNISEYTQTLHEILQKKKEDAIRHLRMEERKGVQSIDRSRSMLQRTITELKEMNRKLSMKLAAQPQLSFFDSVNNTELKTFETLPSSDDYAFSDFQPQLLHKELQENFGKLPYLRMEKIGLYGLSDQTSEVYLRKSSLRIMPGKHLRK